MSISNFTHLTPLGLPDIAIRWNAEQAVDFKEAPLCYFSFYKTSTLINVSYFSKTWYRIQFQGLAIDLSGDRVSPTSEVLTSGMLL
jgi:hypothetical protein